MAKTKDGKKRVYVHGYERGKTTVRTHYRSTPNPQETSLDTQDSIDMLNGQDEDVNTSTCDQSTESNSNSSDGLIASLAKLFFHQHAKIFQKKA